MMAQSTRAAVLNRGRGPLVAAQNWQEVGKMTGEVDVVLYKQAQLKQKIFSWTNREHTRFWQIYLKPIYCEHRGRPVDNYPIRAWLVFSRFHGSLFQRSTVGNILVVEWCWVQNVSWCSKKMIALIPSGTTYLCEADFLVMTARNTKCTARLTAQDDMRVC